MKTTVYTILLSLMVTAAGYSQDLNRLQARAQKLLDLRSSLKSNKSAAAQYINMPDRPEFLETNPLPMQDAKVVGLEFTDDPKLVYVVFKAKVVLPDIGAVPRTGREPWVWDKKDWFLHIEEAGDPFAALRNTTAPSAPPVKPLPFEFVTTHVDLGKHVQGEILKGVVEFKSNHQDVFLFRPAELPGLSFGAPVWKSNEEGQIEFQLDTTIISEDVKYEPEIEVDGYEHQRTRRAFELVAQIEPRLRFTQVPPLVEPTKAGQVEIRMENLSNIPFSFKTVFMTNDSYHLVKDPPDMVRPGETTTFTFTYDGKAEPQNAQLQIELKDSIVGKRGMIFPLRINLPAPVVPGYTREQLEEFIRKSKP
jgi:hypothetical protein